jgi:flagellar biosynthesis GTPase FlhF
MGYNLFIIIVNMMDFKKIYDFIIKGGKLIGALAMFSALFIGLVKFANHSLEKEVDTIKYEVSSIKNNHLEHVNSDIKELKDGQEEIRKDMNEKFEKQNEKFEKQFEKQNEKMNKIENDVSYIRGLLEKQFKGK